MPSLLPAEEGSEEGYADSEEDYAEDDSEAASETQSCPSTALELAEQQGAWG